MDINERSSNAFTAQQHPRINFNKYNSTKQYNIRTQDTIIISISWNTILFAEINNLSEHNFVAPYQNEDLGYQLGRDGSSVDPYALITRQDDAEWSTFCKWIVMAMYYANEESINSYTAHEKLPLVELFGQQYNTLLRHAVAAVGSIGDVYRRNFGIEVLPRVATRNDLNMMPYGPQHFPRVRWRNRNLYNIFWNISFPLSLCTKIWNKIRRLSNFWLNNILRSFLQ